MQAFLLFYAVSAGNCHVLSHSDSSCCVILNANWRQTRQTLHSVVWQILTLRLLISYIYIYIYIYGAPILDVPRSHNDAAQSVGLLWTSDQLVAETST